VQETSQGPKARRVHIIATARIAPLPADE
jgi:hypothetical protein